MKRKSFFKLILSTLILSGVMSTSIIANNKKINSNAADVTHKFNHYEFVNPGKVWHEGDIFLNSEIIAYFDSYHGGSSTPYASFTMTGDDDLSQRGLYGLFFDLGSDPDYRCVLSDGLNEITTIGYTAMGMLTFTVEVQAYTYGELVTNLNFKTNNSGEDFVLPHSNSAEPIDLSFIDEGRKYISTENGNVYSGVKNGTNYIQVCDYTGFIFRLYANDQEDLYFNTIVFDFILLGDTTDYEDKFVYGVSGEKYHEDRYYGSSNIEDYKLGIRHKIALTLTGYDRFTALSIELGGFGGDGDGDLYGYFYGASFYKSTAQSTAINFRELMNKTVCQSDGSTDTNELKTAWNTMKANYNSLSTDEKDKFTEPTSYNKTVELMRIDFNQNLNSEDPIPTDGADESWFIQGSNYIEMGSGGLTGLVYDDPAFKLVGSGCEASMDFNDYSKIYCNKVSFTVFTSNDKATFDFKIDACDSKQFHKFLNRGTGDYQTFTFDLEDYFMPSSFTFSISGDSATAYGKLQSIVFYGVGNSITKDTSLYSIEFETNGSGNVLGSEPISKLFSRGVGYIDQNNSTNGFDSLTYTSDGLASTLGVGDGALNFVMSNLGKVRASKILITLKIDVMLMQESTISINGVDMLTIDSSNSSPSALKTYEIDVSDDPNFILESICLYIGGEPTVTFNKIEVIGPKDILISQEVIDMLAAYDYIYAKYGEELELEDFLGRSSLIQSTYRPISPFNKENKDATMPIIIVIGLIAVTTVCGLYFFKRKEK